MIRFAVAVALCVLLGITVMARSAAAQKSSRMLVHTGGDYPAGWLHDDDDGTTEAERLRTAQTTALRYRNMPLGVFVTLPVATPIILQPLVVYQPYQYRGSIYTPKRYATPLRSFLFGTGRVQHIYAPVSPNGSGTR